MDWIVIASIGVVSAWATVVLLRSLYIDTTDCDALAPYPVRAFICRKLDLVTPLAAAAFPTIYALFFWSTTGQTPGKRVAGLRIVRVDGKPMNFVTAVRRLAGYVVSMILIGSGSGPS